MQLCASADFDIFLATANASSIRRVPERIYLKQAGAKLDHTLI